MQPLKILFVTPQYRPAIGCTERHVARWAEELVRRGHQAHIFTMRSTHQPTRRGSLPGYERSGVRVRRFRQWKRGPRTLRLMNWSYSGFSRIGQRRRLLKEFPNLMWVSAGPGDTTENLPAATRSESFRMRWRNLETVDEEAKWRLLSACDVLCMPSTGEAFGVVYPEAWLCGKPVIGANSGAVPGVIAHGVDGFVVEPRDVEGLTAYLARLQQNPDLARKMGQAGRRKALTHFTAQSVGDALEGALARALRLGCNKRLQKAFEAR